uniref:Hyaluronidase n=3 Tax=Lygus hesperus TaxID=30085 RepID=A0A146KZS6_LYGHE
MWDQNWGGLNVYRTYSRSLERRKHPFWLNYMIEVEATNRYEMMAKAFLLSTLKKAKRLRPAASWGYYGYPFCFNYTPNNYRETCSTQVQEDNDNTGWLFDEMTAYYPSLYLRERDLTAYQRKRFVSGRLAETTRLVEARIRNGTIRPPLIFPYVWFKYHDTRNFMTPEDMLHVLTAPAQIGAKGVVIWGASRDVNSKEKCEALVDYVEKVLGPAVQQAKAGGARRRRQPRVHPNFQNIETNRL